MFYVYLTKIANLTQDSHTSDRLAICDNGSEIIMKVAAVTYSEVSALDSYCLFRIRGRKDGVRI